MRGMEPVLLEIGETAHALRRAFDRRASQLGVTRAQWRVLVKLGRNPGIRQVELADMLDIEPITLSRIVDRLQAAGRVERLRAPSDRRAWRLELTAKSKPLVEKLRALASDLSAEAFAGLDERELTEIRRNLTRVRGNVAAASGVKKACSE